MFITGQDTQAQPAHGKKRRRKMKETMRSRKQEREGKKNMSSKRH
jgi:hypothetical protein